jgi:hypothetical protein
VPEARIPEEHRPAGRGSPIFVTYPPRNILNALLLAGVVLLVALAAAGPAVAKSSTECWKTLINDWYDGRIDGTYAIHCYRDALKHLPADVDTYSSARDDIKQALQERITQSHTTTTTGGGSKSAGPGGGTGGSSGGTGGPKSTGGSGGGTGGSKSAGPSGGTGGSSGGTGGPKSAGPSGGAGGPKSGTTTGDKTAVGPIGQVFSVGKPSKADSVPIPLIVLGAVALLLMAAGAAGFMTRRLRMRRLQLTSASALPQRPDSLPPERD